MVWFKVDDGFYSSQKVLSIPRSCRVAAVGLWTLAGNWSGRELSDGRVPNFVLAEIGATPRLRRALVEARLWLDHGSAGIEFHSWADYQPTRAEVEAERAKAAERQRKWRDRHKGETGDEHVSHTVTNDVTNSVSHDAPTRPDPTLSSSTKKKPPASRGERLNPQWLPSAEDIAKIRSECPDIDPQREHVEFVDYWVGAPGNRGVKADWPATWRNWMRRRQRESVGRSPVKKPAVNRNMDTVAFFANQQQMGIEA